MRALAVVNCQRATTWASLRSSSQAATSSSNSATEAIRRSRHCLVSAASSISAMFSHDPCLGVVVPLHLLRDPPRPRRPQRLVQAAQRVRVEVVRYQHHLPGPLVDLFHQPPQELGEVRGRALRGDLCRPPAQQRLEGQEDVRRPVADVFVVVLGRLPRPGGQRHPRLADELDRQLVQADQRPPLVTGPVVDLQDVLHAGHELAVGLRRDAPLLLQVRLQLVFLRVRRTVSSLTESTTPSSTSLSAKSFKVQRACPLGGAEQAVAISRASAAPSSLRSRLGRSWGLRPRAASGPRSTNRWRTRSTVRVPQSRASAMRASSQAGPPSAWSALSRMRARVMTRAERLPADTRAVRWSRSAAVRVTRYFFFGMGASYRAPG